ncbi:MAG TPA: exodeoxyribonuclease III [Aestuariivirgaceae bacterium]|jgi:exodeoxyribonuclease-3
MPLRVATWNINSVRLRIGLAVRLLKENQIDVLCLQETKCPSGQFPSAAFKEAGYSYFAEHGQAGYHGVAIVSRLSFVEVSQRQFCGKTDARHISARLTGDLPLLIHNLYVPAGGQIPDPQSNEKFAHKLQFLDELAVWSDEEAALRSAPTAIVGDLNVAPHENDVWSHKALLSVVSHTPVETEKLLLFLNRSRLIDAMRAKVSLKEKLFTWWSYRARDWRSSNRGRRLDHIWLDQQLNRSCCSIDVVSDVRGWERPSDHVPVIATLG